MPIPDVYIFGASHVGIRLARRLVKNGHPVVLFDECSRPAEQPAGWEFQSIDFAALPPLGETKMVYIVTDEDKLNIRTALAVRSALPSQQIVITLSQSRLGNKLALHLKNFSSVSPPELAAKTFVNALSLPAPSHAPMTPQTEELHEGSFRKHRNVDPLVLKALLFFAALAGFTTLYFHYQENLSWIDSWYFVVTLMTTVGFGDIGLRNSSSLSKIVGTLLMIASVTNTAIIFALISDSLLRRRLALSFGRKRSKQSGHVLVAGIGSVGLRVVQELIARGESVTVIERDMNGRFMPEIFDLRIPVVIGDAKLESTLRNAALPQAKALIVVTNDDLTNLEVGLSAKLLNPQARVVLRIYDHQLAQSLDERLDIHFAYSASAIAAEALASFLVGEPRAQAL